MKTLFSISAILAAALFVSGCAALTPPGHVPPGFLYTSVKGPVDTGFRKAKAAKTGMACGSNILSIVATGDNSIDAAKKAGGIKKVATVDYENFSVLGLYTKVCVHVTGD